MLHFYNVVVTIIITWGIFFADGDIKKWGRLHIGGIRFRGRVVDQVKKARAQTKTRGLDFFNTIVSTVRY